MHFVSLLTQILANFHIAIFGISIKTSRSFELTIGENGLTNVTSSYERNINFFMFLQESDIPFLK